jgi:hypothetical protein
MNSLLRDRWVCVMADHASSCIWTKHGSLADLNDLLVEGDTYFHIGAWQFWFERVISRNPDTDELDRFVQAGWAIVRAIKRQHPDWTVVYFDEKAGKRFIRVGLWLTR